VGDLRALARVNNKSKWRREKEDIVDGIYGGKRRILDAD